MNLVALILAVVAAVCFALDAARFPLGRSLVAVGLLALTLAWVAQLTLTGSLVRF